MKLYYVAESYMGLNYTYDSDCWRVIAFETKQLRNAWLSRYGYRNNQWVAKEVTRKEAKKIRKYFSIAWYISEIYEFIYRDGYKF